MNSYLKYIEQVLGVQKILVDRKEVLGANAPADHEFSHGSFEVPAFFYNDSGPIKAGQNFYRTPLAIINFIDKAEDSLFESQVADLFGKMKAALKLPEDKILNLDCVLNERALVVAEFLKIAEVRCVLLFSREPEKLGQMQKLGEAIWVQTFSPAVLLERPDLKKQVWSDMQKLMKELAI